MNSPESTMERDLQAIDDALRGAPRDRDREVGELQDLALALRADDARARRRVRRATMRGRVKAGFLRARARLAPGLRQVRPRPGRCVPAGSGFAGMLLVALCVALVVVLPSGDSGGGDDDGGAAAAAAAARSGDRGLERPGAARAVSAQRPRRRPSAAPTPPVAPAPPAGASRPVAAIARSSARWRSSWLRRWTRWSGWPSG